MKRHFTVTVNGQKFDVAVVENDPAGAVVEQPHSVASQPKAPSLAAAKATKCAVAPMSGKIIAVLVKEGDKVDRGQPLVVLEAMKLENDIVALDSGTVGKVLVQVGQVVETGAELVLFS